MDNDDKLIFENYWDRFRPDVPGYSVPEEHKAAVQMFYSTLEKFGYTEASPEEASKLIGGSQGARAFKKFGPKPGEYHDDNDRPMITVATLIQETDKPNPDRPEYQKPDLTGITDIEQRLLMTANEFAKWAKNNPKSIYGIGLEIYISVADTTIGTAFPPGMEEVIEDIASFDINSDDDIIDALNYIVTSTSAMDKGPYERSPTA